MAKIGIIGVGKNGEAFAHKLLPLGYDLYLLNRTPKRAYGVMEDLIDGYPHCRSNIHVCETYDESFMSTDIVFVLVKGNYEYSDFKVLTDLRTRGLPRDGYLLNNVANKLRGYKGKVVVVSNPVDVNAKLVMERAGLSTQQVFAYGSALDTWRGQNKIAEFLGINLDPKLGNREKLNTFFIGEHGDKSFGLWSIANYNGKSIFDYGIDKKICDEIEIYVRKRGVEVMLTKYDTTIGTAMPLPETVNFLLGKAKENTIFPISIFDEKHNVFYGQPVIKQGDIFLSKMPSNMSNTEVENLEAAIEKIKGSEDFARSLYLDRQKRNILYVDDEETTLLGVMKAIKAMALNDSTFYAFNTLNIQVARTLREARDKLYSTVGGIDVLLIDHRLIGDEMDGINFVKQEVAPNHPFTVSVILSGQAREDDLKSAIGPSFGGYIQKPFDIENPTHWQILRNALYKTEEGIII